MILYVPTLDEGFKSLTPDYPELWLVQKLRYWTMYNKPQTFDQAGPNCVGFRTHIRMSMLRYFEQRDT
jgi:hypothetical protein